MLAVMLAVAEYESESESESDSESERLQFCRIRCAAVQSYNSTTAASLECWSASASHAGPLAACGHRRKDTDDDAKHEARTDFDGIW